MNEATLKIKSKIEVGLKEAERKMKIAEDRASSCGYLHYDYWRKECLSLRKELREINTGRVQY